ncbi:MAG: alanine racemase [Bacteroidetes bacterium]|nr:alanine racemase [Bacteroidota bacterium]
MLSPSYIELDTAALENNFSFLRQLVGRNVRISSVVKSDAYGHGIDYFVPIALKCGVDHFSVFSSDEAFRVWEITHGNSDICIMGFIPEEDLTWVIENGIEFYVFDVERLLNAIRIARSTGKRAKIHIEIETGMNRTGLDKAGLERLVKLYSAYSSHIDVMGLCTHFAGAESIANHVRIKKQLKIFNQTYQWLKNQGINPKIRHTACSAASVSYPQTRMDMVRIGIMQYGFWPSRETFIQYVHRRKSKKDPLIRVLSWKSRIMSIKDVREGEFISYGTSYLAQEDKRIAVIPVGYYHGYTRSLSNQGRVLIKGHQAPVIGLVNMNMLVADINGMDGVKPGDEVVLIGRQGDRTISVSSFSEFSDLLNYELLTRLPSNIRRVVR